MIIRAMLAAAIALSTATSALAQMPPQPPPPKMPFPTGQGNEQERAACQPDVVKYCKDSIPDQFRILTCLQTNRQKISRACGGVLTSHGI
jgi:hypothetical protein